MMSWVMGHGSWVLAETGLTPETVGTIFGAFVIALIGGGVLGKKVSDVQRMRVEGQPSGQALEVALQDQYVTRSEFFEFKGEMKSDLREMKGLFDKTMVLINERDTRLTEMIKEFGTAGYNGRSKIHDKLNPIAERVAAIEARTDVSKAIGKLGSAIMASRPKFQS